MSGRRTSGENHVETVTLQGSKPSKSKSFDDTRKSQKINMKSEISKLSADMKILIELAEGDFILSKELEKVIGRSGETVKKYTDRLAAAGLIEKTSKGCVISTSKVLTLAVREALKRANPRIKVNEALQELSAEKYVCITLYDVSSKTRMAPRVIEKDVYLLAPDHGLTVAAESSWNYELSEGEHVLDVITKNSIRKELSQVDPKSRKN